MRSWSLLCSREVASADRWHAKASRARSAANSPPLGRGPTHKTARQSRTAHCPKSPRPSACAVVEPLLLSAKLTGGTTNGPNVGFGKRTPFGARIPYRNCRHAGGAWAAKMRLCVELCSKRAPLGTTVWTVSVCMCVDSFWYGIRTPKLTPKAARLSPHAAPMPSASGTDGCRNGDRTMPQNGPVRVATASRPGATSAPRKQRTRRDLTQAHGRSRPRTARDSTG